jgi:lipoprotein NlpI
LHVFSGNILLQARFHLSGQSPIMFQTPKFLLATALLVAAFCASAQTATQARKISADGFTYTIERTPSWVRDTPISSKVPSHSSPWHYALIDDQIKVESATQHRYVHVARRFTDAAGVADGAQLAIYFNPKFQTLAIHEIAVVRASGKLDELKPANIRLLQQEDRLEQQVYGGWVTASVLVPGVRVGDMLQYRYTITGENPVFDRKFVYNHRAATNPNPTALQTLRIIFPRERQIAYKAHDPAIKVESEQIGPNTELRVRLEDVGVPNFLPDTPPAIWLKTLVQFSEFTDWESVATWGEKLFATDNAVPESLRSQIQTWSAASSSETERARSALNFVQKDIRYFSVSLGDSSHRPTPPDKVLAQRYGDCKDKSLLLVTTLRAMGIRAQPVLVSSQLRGVVQNLLPSPLNFDHAIVIAQIDGKEYWLDPTRSFESGPLADRHARNFNRGLAVGGGAKALAATPESAQLPQEFSVSDTYVVKKFKEPVELTAVIEYRGELAERVQRLWQSPQRSALEKEWIAEYSRRYPSLRSKSEAELVLEPDLNRLKVKLNLEIADFFEYPNAERLAASFLAWGLLGDLRPGFDAARQQPLWLGAPRRIEHRIELLLPERVFRQPSELRKSVKDEHFLLETHASVDGQRYRFNTSLQLTKEVVNTSNWREFSTKAREAGNMLVADMAFGAMGLDQLQKLTAAIEALKNDRDVGRTKIFTQVQWQSEIQRMAVNEHLFSGRLTRNQEASALFSRALALNQLGYSKLALDDMRASLALKAGTPDTLGEYAEILWGTGDFDGALQQIRAARAIGNVSSTTEAELDNREATALFSQRKYSEAAALFKKVATNTSSDRKWFSVAWYALSAKLSGQAKFDVLAEFPLLDEDQAFAQQIVRFVGGKLSADSLWEKTKADAAGVERSRKCEADFYIGMLALQQGDQATGRRRLQAAVDSKVMEYREQRAAGFELAKL